MTRENVHRVVDSVNHLVTQFGEGCIVEPQSHAVVSNLLRQLDLVIKNIVVVVAPNLVCVRGIRRDEIRSPNLAPFGAGDLVLQGRGRLRRGGRFDSRARTGNGNAEQNHKQEAASDFGEGPWPRLHDAAEGKVARRDSTVSAEQWPTFWKSHLHVECKT